MKKQKWNDNWKFWEMEDSFTLIWNTPEDAAVIQLPHDGMLAHRAYAESISGGNSGYRDGGHFCYSKLLEIPEKRQGKYILLFDGVYENAAVYVNGQLACRHPYGYTQFYVDLSPLLEWGKSNEIRVMTNNTASGSRWYSGGGIYRDVYLLTTDSPVHIAPDGVKIKTKKLDLSQNYAEIEISTMIINETAEEKSVELQTAIKGREEEYTEKITLAPEENKIVIQTLRMGDAPVWNENSPELCVCESRLFSEKEGEKALYDSNTARFGIRTLELDPLHGLRINGKSVKLRGACIHHDNGIIGAAAFKDAEYRKVKKLKQAGFNAIRVAHNPASTALLDACDELGMYIMNESFDMWTRNKTDYDYADYFVDWWERDIEAMVQSSFNHPSVIMYSLGNEIPEIGTVQGVKICCELASKTKQLDDSRYTTVAINGVFSVGDIIPQIMEDVLGTGENKENQRTGNVNEFLTVMDQNIDKIVVHDKISERLARASDVVDISGYNYMVARYEKDVKENPQRIIVGSETYPPEISRIWKIINQHSQIIGDFTWTGWDYIGEAGVGIPAYRFGEGGFGAKFPCQLSYVGDIDITGIRRPASYYREIIFGLRTDPYIVVQDPHHYHDEVIKTPWVLTSALANWNYPEMEGNPICVEVYSPGDEVELFINGKSLGRKEVGEKNAYKVFYETTYEGGVLKAVSRRKGMKIGETDLKTPEREAGLCATVEEDHMAELVFVDIELCDENGILFQSCDEKIYVNVSGALESWLGTGNPKPLTNYTDLETTLWNGRALLVVRKENMDDVVHVTIKSDRQSVNIQI